MARLAARAKLLYYPTPASVINKIASYFRAANPYRICDPCAGTGEALTGLVAGIGQSDVETWGIELSYSRAAEAENRLDKVLPISFYSVRWGSRTTSMIFNNPPYDWSQREDANGRKIRHERLFVIESTPRLVDGGHQIIIIPRNMLADEKLIRHLIGWYERIVIRKFTEADGYERFKQIVIFALGKRRDYVHATKDALGLIMALADAEKVCLYPLKANSVNGAISIPPTPHAGKFEAAILGPQALVNRAAESAPDTTRLTHVRAPGAPIQPIVPEKIGHISMEISSGEVGTIPFAGMLAKGSIYKAVEVVERTDETDANGHYSHTDVMTRERLVTRITTVDEDGEMQMLNDSVKVGEFITEHADKIADALLQRNKPLYDFKPTAREWDVVGKTALGLPPLPGREKRGLFEAQKHMAIAAVRAMRHNGQSIIMGEMGSGKTATSIGAAELLDRWPVLVVAPGHMLHKWARSIAQACDPDDPITPRIITRPVRNKDDFWWGERVERLEEKGICVIGKRERFQIPPVSRNDPGLRVRFTVSCDNAKNALKVVKSLFTLRSKKFTAIPPEITLLSSRELEVVAVDRDDYTLFDFVSDYKSGKLGRKAAAVISIQAAKYGSGVEDLPVCKSTVLRENDISVSVSGVKCPSCGTFYELVEGIPHFCTHKITKPVFDESGEVIDEKEVVCKSPLFSMSRWHREGLARIVQRKFKGFFQLLVTDEVHAAKGGDTNVGAADGRLVSSIPYGLALTGTLFGGTASSIFYLFYRRNQEVRQAYAFEDKTRWVDHFGRWEHRWKEKPTDRSVSTGIKRYSSRAKELPGVSPAVIRYLLPLTLFMKITDLGYELPRLHEYVEELPMSPALKEQYAEMDKDLLDKAMSLLQSSGDPGGLATWFSAIRYRPASAFRDEVVRYTDQNEVLRIEMELPHVVGEMPYLPKEESLADIVSRNMEYGRKTLVYVEQTGTRDIRERLQATLEAQVPGARVQSLSANDMPPAAREVWIKTETPNMDVLLVNPKLVETGLDLVQFNEVVFYELPLSLYTLWQAMRRVWRLGQDQEVDCTFLVYAETVEAALLSRMGEKLKAALVLYGDEATGALVETDDSDLQREMIQQALEGKSYGSLGDVAAKGVFAQGDEKQITVSTSPSGSPIGQSPRMVVLLDEDEFVKALRNEEVVQLAMF